ncbi:MAG: hypothetical protein JWM53_1020, partial [bacterium]|nr:hypothetical protein [bacterium]
DIGTVELAPATRARIVASDAKQQRLELDRGTLAAKFDAPPRVFAIATRRLVVTDLGCAFLLTVDDAGRGKLVVSAGKVAVADGRGREVVVPAGAQCELGDDGAGAPYAIDAPAPAPRQPSDGPAPKRQRKGPHATQKLTTPAHATPHKSEPARKNAPTRKNAPAHENEPARKDAPAGITHDPLKDLERSVE